MADYEEDDGAGSGEYESDAAGHGGDEKDNNEYYAFLNVARDASDADIKAAYRKLVLLYHPDKHRDPELKEKADLMFNKLKEAFDVLSDPHKRALYDTLGKAALKDQDCWKIVEKLKSPKEIRDEYEALAKLREERLLQQRTNPTSRFEVTMDATGIFERYRYNPNLADVVVKTGDDLLTAVKIGEISFGQTVDCPISLSKKCVLSGDVATETNGRGSGNIGLSYESNHEKSWSRYDIRLGRPSSGAYTYQRIFNPKTYANANVALNLQRGLSPAFTLTFGRIMTEKLRCDLNYSISTVIQVDPNEEDVTIAEESSAIGFSTSYTTPFWYIHGSLKLGVPLTYALVSVARKFPGPEHHNLKLRGVFRFGTFGFNVKYGVERSVTSHSVLSVLMDVGYPTGVKLRIRLNRGRQVYVFPILLSEEIIPQSVFFGTVTPLLTWYAVKKLVLDPYNANHKRKQAEKRLEENRAKLAQIRKEAAASRDLMKERYSNLVRAQSEKNSLVIIAAVYGSLEDDSGVENPFDFDRVITPLNERSFDGDVVRYVEIVSEDLSEFLRTKHFDLLDVTVQLQCLIDEGGRLSLHGNGASKTDLAGFFDPCPTKPDVEKRLLVRYLHQGRLFQVNAGDRESLILPRSTHKLEA